jgi:hypothetical protein
MSTKHNLHVASPIPRSLSPETVIAALHNHETVLTLQALTCGHKLAPSTAPETLKDTYWYPPDQYPVSTYHVTEAITLLPFLGERGKKYITFPSCIQDTRQGIKTRADAAAGIIVRAEFRVVENGDVGSEVEGEGMGVGDAQWVLVEDVEVSCAWWLMPFVRGKMEQAHRGICQLVVEMVVQMTEGDDSGERGGERKGKERAEEDGDTHTGFAQEMRQHYEKPQPVVFGGAHRHTEGVHEADAQETQRVEMPGAPLPEKITYR